MDNSTGHIPPSYGGVRNAAPPWPFSLDARRGRAYIQSTRHGFDGIGELAIDAAGDLAIRVGGDSFRQKPYSYQDGPERHRDMPCRFVLSGDRQVGFAVGAYDATRPLVIDPVVTFSSHCGGDSGEIPCDVAVGPGGTVSGPRPGPLALEALSIKH